MNKKQCILSSILSVILVAVVLLSLTDCAFVTHHPSWSPWSTDGFLTAQKITTYYTNYSPLWVGVFTGFQLFLLWVLRKPFACWLGIVLNIVGTILPWFRMVMEAPIEKWSESMFTDVYNTYNEYVFEPPFYCIMILSAAIIVLYIILFVFRRKNMKRMTPVQAYAYPGSGETEKLINVSNSNPVNSENTDQVSGEEGNEGTLN